LQPPKDRPRSRSCAPQSVLPCRAVRASAYHRSGARNYWPQGQLENGLLPRVGFAGRPQTNGNVEALHRTILKECWRPAFARYLYLRYTGLRRELETYLRYYNFDRVRHGRLTRGRIPADIIYGARKDGGEMSRACRHTRCIPRHFVETKTSLLRRFPRGERRDSNPRPPGPQPGRSRSSGVRFGSLKRSEVL
jgi:hypothetical protein